MKTLKIAIALAVCLNFGFGGAFDIEQKVLIVLSSARTVRGYNCQPRKFKRGKDHSHLPIPIFSSVRFQQQRKRLSRSLIRGSLFIVTSLTQTW